MAPESKSSLRLANPVMTASGTFGYGTENDDLNVEQLGAFVCKGTTLKPREGNPQPRVAETPAGMLNSIGLQNIGVEALINEKAPVWAGWRVPVIVNIAGETEEDYAQMAARLDGIPGISAFEVNISCPNVKGGGAEFGAEPEVAARVTAMVRGSTSLPVLVKLTPNTPNIKKVALAVAAAGADALTVINTLKGLAIDVKRRRPLLGTVTGGLSGPAVKPVALYMVYEVSRAVGVPVIGCGGIITAEDALEFIMAGASAVQIGTAGFVNPEAPFEILAGINDFMTQEGVADIKDLIGIAHCA